MNLAENTPAIAAAPAVNPVNDTSANKTTPGTGVLLLGPENTLVQCPFCQTTVRTSVLYTNSSATHMAAALWGRICCLCCLPYSTNECKNSDHYCPECLRYLGTYRR